MRIEVFGWVAAVSLIAACDTTVPSDGGPAPGYIGELPEGLAAIAAPNQNLSTVRILPEDGCYWYLHDGPVESTLLPLRTTEGNPICARAQAATG